MPIHEKPVPLAKQALSGGNTFVEIEVFARLNRKVRRADEQAASTLCDKLVHAILLETERTNPRSITAKEVLLTQVRAAFEHADLGPIFVEEVPNEYSDAEWKLHDPWLIVTTSLGHFKVGWRKRVIHLEWTKTTILGSGEDIFPNEQTTKGISRDVIPRMIHAWGYEKLAEYLTAIKMRANSQEEQCAREEAGLTECGWHFYGKVLNDVLPTRAWWAMRPITAEGHDFYAATKAEVVALAAQAQALTDSYERHDVERIFEETEARQRAWEDAENAKRAKTVTP